jgi:hypothetical protein
MQWFRVATISSLLVRRLGENTEKLRELHLGWVKIAKRERHELPLVPERDATLPLMEIKGPTVPWWAKYGADHIKDVIVPDQTVNYMDHEPENTSPSKE